MGINRILLFTLLITFNVIASDYESVIKNVSVSESDAKLLSIQNLSDEYIEVDISGTRLNLKPVSGLVFECSEYEDIEIEFKNKSHDFFEIPCSSNIIISELYTITEEGI